MKNLSLVIAALFASIGTAQAQEGPASPVPSQLQWMAGIGASVGGDDLASARYTNADSADIKAGSGVYFTGGANYRFSPEFSLQGTVNFHVDDTNAKNGSIKFQRFPVELMAYYHFNSQWRVGAGGRYVSGAKLSSSGVVSGLNIEFDNTASTVVEGEYFWTPNIGMKLRYVNETFKNARYRDVKANHVGISGNYYF